MSLTCFISHNADESERVFVFRLQTLATSSGITVLLPHRAGRILTMETRDRIAAADVFIAFLTASRLTQVHQELSVAQTLRKPIIAIYRKGSAPRGDADVHWIEYDPAKGLAPVEQAILAHLKQQLSAKQSRQVALVAVLGIALLAMLTNQSSSK